MYFLSVQPLWLSWILVFVVPTGLAMLGPALVRRCTSLERLRSNNEVAGFKFATVGVLYAVLLAFVVIVLWERFNEAEKSVGQEAGAAATIYRLADGLESGPGTAVRERLNGYIEAAIANDWPAMQRGGASPVATRALNDLYAAALAFHPGDQRGAVVMAGILTQLDLVTQARRGRLVLATGIVPGIVWLVLLVGAVLTIGFTLFFGTENLRAQTLMTGMLAALIFSELFVIVAIDYPFAGPVKVRPEALTAVLEQLGSAPRHQTP